MRRPDPACLLALASLLAATPARAATFVINAGEPPVVVVSGEIVPGDGERFADRVQSLDRAIVALASPGGSVLSGLRMGQLIHDRGFSTLVPDRAVCASACGLVWLAGKRRFMEPEARIGFHAAYIVRRGRAQESGAGNALIGAYLSRLGLTDRAILYVAQAAPDDMTWLTPSAAGRLGLDLTVLTPREAALPVPLTPPRDGGTKAPAPGTEPPPAVTVSNRPERAMAFASKFYSIWSDTNARALGAFRTFYADTVLFYGTRATRQALMERKEAFAQRWPERVYAVQGDTMTAKCGAERCVVTGTVAWDARNAPRDTRTVGTARFELTLDVRSDPLIVAETGTVLTRGDGSEGAAKPDAPVPDAPAPAVPTPAEPAPVTPAPVPPAPVPPAPVPPAPAILTPPLATPTPLDLDAPTPAMRSDDKEEAVDPATPAAPVATPDPAVAKTNPA